uniref:PiggyBac transposable element-derived protein 4 C-terminal zinc-ribbon domain-containing protein n=1 Tax=Glossina morsitans morsitans TaxID=37546 RepID=A0A1B0FQB1_GLOMM
MEICIINAYTLYKTIKKQKGQKPKTHLKFAKQLVDELIGSFRVKRIKKSCSSISESRLNGKLHVMRRGTKKGLRETTEYCDTCPNKPRMHMGHCFHKYQTKLNYKI